MCSTIAAVRRMSVFCVQLSISIYITTVDRLCAGIYSVCVGNLASRFSAKLVYFFLATYVVDNLRQHSDDLKEFDDEVNNVSVCIMSYKQPRVTTCSPLYYRQGRINTKLGLMLLPRQGPIIFSAFKTDQEPCDATTLY